MAFLATGYLVARWPDLKQARAAELREQLHTFRSQAQFFDRLRVSVYADEKGLVMDQVMEFR